MKKVIYCNRGWFPVYYGFCPSKAAWKREMKRLNVANCDYPSSDGKCTTFESSDGGTTILVTIGEHIDGKDPLGIVGLIVHEATHVWQQIRKDIGEHAPSIELEAYAMQNISQELISAYSETRMAK